MSNRYDNMHFTEAEEKALIQNRDKICAWIKENIIPKLEPTEYDRIKIDFGGVYRSYNDFGKGTTEYLFAVYGAPTDIYFNGRVNKDISIGYGVRYGGVESSFETKTSPYSIYPVVDNWSMIKSELLKGAAERQERKANINSFTI